MNNEPFGNLPAFGEVFSQYSAELDIDAVGMWHIVPRAQRVYGLTGGAVAEYVRRAINAILDAGGVPVRHIPGSGYEWVQQKQYGNIREQIVEALIFEWQSLPEDSIALAGAAAWFARPDPNYPMYVKVD